MKVLISPDKFKYSLTGSQICNIIGKALPKQFYKQFLPLGDGGDGSLAAIKQSVKGQEIQVQACDPLFRRRKASYFLSSNKVSFIEMAKISGLQLLQKNQRNPMKTSTFGTGELIKNSIIFNQSKQLYLMIGGSATNDGGIGMAAALGYEFYDANNSILEPIGENLVKIQRIKRPEIDIIGNTKVTIMSDVKNILCGKDGASSVYGPQKGATPKQIIELDQGLLKLDQIFSKDFHQSIKDLEGSGAAGGLGGGSIIFLNAQIKSGIQTIMQILNFQEKVKQSNLIITGQGKLDQQTLSGKVIKGVIEVARKFNKKVVIFCGKAQIPHNYFGSDIQIVSLLNDSITEQYCIKNAQTLLEDAVYRKFQQFY